MSEACASVSEAGVPCLRCVRRPLQEEMALQLINCPDYTLQPYQHSYLRSTAILVLSLLMVVLGDPQHGWGLGWGRHS